MCSNGGGESADPASQLLTFRFKTSSLAQHSPQLLGLHPTAMSPAALAEYQRLQLYDYAQAASRFRLTHPALMSAGPYTIAGAAAYASSVDGQPAVPYALSPFVRFDPRARFLQEEPKPQHSYIGLIAMAILSSPEKKMVLSDIYQYILDNYPYFRNRGPGWRNSIRHNLSLNDCFVKAGRSANGKGHYWAIHPANVEDFKKGDFRRRKAQRKVRKHMGLSVPDDDDSPTPTPPPPTIPPDSSLSPHPWSLHQRRDHTPGIPDISGSLDDAGIVPRFVVRTKRQFDVESLLAPDPVLQNECGVGMKDDDPFKDIETKKLTESGPYSSMAFHESLKTGREAGEIYARGRVRLSGCSSPDEARGPHHHHSGAKSISETLLNSRKSLSPPQRQSLSSSPPWSTPVSLQNLQVQAKLPLCNFSNGLVFPVGTAAWVPSTHQAMLTYEFNQQATNASQSSTLTLHRAMGESPPTAEPALNFAQSNPVNTSMSSSDAAAAASVTVSTLRRWTLPPAHSNTVERPQEARN